MATLPQINIDLQVEVQGIQKSGSLVYNYDNFYNLLSSDGELGKFKIDNDKFGLSLKNPIDIEIQPSYDGSVNLILNDDLNKPKLINSRFIVGEDNTFTVADRTGDVDTNIYQESNFEIDTSLLKIVEKIPTLDYLGLDIGGKMPIGNYTFYFKYADADDNETDFISESGKVVCHIGKINDPKSIRGGLVNEDSQKKIKFRLNNIDLAYPYIKVYYTKSTGTQDENQIVTAHQILDRYKVKGSSTDIIISGYEEHIEVSISDINQSFQLVDTVKTQTQCQNMLFFGNVTNNYDVFEELKDLSLRITPKISREETIGNISNSYVESSMGSEGWEYYNTKNIYYKLGYWDEEIYRLGIVYILNDYSLSPVFNIRGIKTLSENTPFTNIPVYDSTLKYVKVNDDYSLEANTLENAKGVFKIDASEEIFSENAPINPIGLGVDIPSEILEDYKVGGNVVRDGLKTLTKGFFIVRQNRIPDIISQGLSIGKTKYGHLPIIKTSQDLYITQSFLRKDGGYNSVDYGNYVTVTGDKVEIKSAICPEAVVRTTTLNNFFNSSEYKLKYYKYQPNQYFQRVSTLSTSPEYNRFVLSGFKPFAGDRLSPTSKVTLIQTGVDITTDGDNYYSSRAGNPEQAWKTSDIKYGNLDDFSTNVEDSSSEILSKSEYLIRGEFNTYLGLGTGIDVCRYFNVYKDDYNFDSYWKDYFKIRYNDSSTFEAISDRFDWDNFEATSTLDSGVYSSVGMYRGDCYISTYTHRMNWNFIDPELPTNHKIADKHTWSKNYHVIETYYKNLGVSELATAFPALTDSIGGNDSLSGDQNSSTPTNPITTLLVQATDQDTNTLKYKRLVPIFTMKGNKILEPGDKKYGKYSDQNGTFGYQKINRPDVNAVPLGHWVTFKVCSNVNLSFRDTDSSYPAEEALHKKKRGFYPLDKLNKYDSLPESGVINQGISKTLSDKYYFEIPDSPFLKTQFYNRIMYSDIHISDAFKNGYQVFRTGNHQDYTMNYGAIVKLIDWFGTIICVMENGVVQIPVNERAMVANASGQNVYINTDNVLPKNPKVLSETFGSTWKDSIIKTSRYIYGIDTKGKKIWRVGLGENGGTFETISDMKVQKFLNDYITLKESDRSPMIGFKNIKSHYNAFKQDVMFTFVNGDTEWNLCWNELLEKFITKYTWIPGFSENINNIFYTFDNSMIKNSVYDERINWFDYEFDATLMDTSSFLKPDKLNRFWKHGQAGIIDNQTKIYPTKWYGDQHKFSFEFVVNAVPGVQKIFNNLKIISNKVKPESFSYEIVGEGYDWYDVKDDIIDINASTTPLISLDSAYQTYLQSNSEIKKIPYIDLINGDITITEDYRSKEQFLHFVQNGLDMRTNGRLKGNMMYVEDSWDIQIKPLYFKYAYLKNNSLLKSSNNEMKIRDKFIKIKVEYTGDQLAIISAIKTMFTISYS